MKTRMMILLLLVVICAGCDDEEQQRRAEREAHQEQVNAERDARDVAEKRLADERRKRDVEKQVSGLKLDQESRKSSLALTMAISTGCLAVIVIILLARERRIRNISMAALKWLWRRRTVDHGE